MPFIECLSEADAPSLGTPLEEPLSGTSSGPVKTLLSNAGSVGLIPGQELKSHMPHGRETKT